MPKKPLSKEAVLEISKLARLQLTEKEIAYYQDRLSRVLDHVQELSELKTDANLFVKHIPEDVALFREDDPARYLKPSAILKNAPEAENNLFVLPTVMGGD